MKKYFFLALFSSLFLYSFAQPQEFFPSQKVKTHEVDKGEIIFIRKTGIVGWAIPFKTFINDDLVCKINNKRFSKHKVEAGSYLCTAQFYGKKRNEKREHAHIEVKAGEKKYIILQMNYGFFYNTLSPIEIPEKAALQLISEIKEDRNY